MSSEQRTHTNTEAVEMSALSPDPAAFPSPNPPTTRPWWESEPAAGATNDSSGPAWAREDNNRFSHTVQREGAARGGGDGPSSPFGDEASRQGTNATHAPDDETPAVNPQTSTNEPPGPAPDAPARHPNDDGVLPDPEQLIILPEDLSVTGPMDDLPQIRPPELKIIGRCVSFVADCVERGELRDYYFQGMVAQITKDTVTMIEVLRFTVDGYAQYKSRQIAAAAAAATNATHPNTTHNASQPPVLGANDSTADAANQSRAVAVGTPLPRRVRTSRRVNDGGASFGGLSPGDMPSVTSPVSVTAPDRSLTSAGADAPTTNFLSPMYHPRQGPNSRTVAANNFGYGDADAASSVNGGAAPLYDYDSYNRTNYYINSSTLMPDTSPQANGAAAGRHPFARHVPYQQPPQRAEAAGDAVDTRSPAAAGALFTVLPTHIGGNVSGSPTVAEQLQASPVVPQWQPHQPLAHYKFMTFARRKIRKVEFSNDHPMAGLLQPFYVCRGFQTGWVPKKEEEEEPVAIEGDGVGTDHPQGPASSSPAANTNRNNNTNNNNNNAQQPATAAPTQPVAAHLTAQEQARLTKEKAKKKWAEQQLADTPILLSVPMSYRKSVYNEERNTTHPFMGINLRVADPAGYKARRQQYREAMRVFVQGNAEKVIALTSPTNALTSPLPLVVVGSPNRSTTTNGGESTSSDDDTGSEDMLAINPSPASPAVTGGGGGAEQHGPLSPDTEVMGLKRRPSSATKHLGDRDVHGLSLKHISPETLQQLLAEGAPQRPPAYEYPQTLASIYEDPKWRQHNPYILQDLERVRMFIRRYIVHTSQGNNQKKIPLIIFVSQRCPWPNPPEGLLKELLYTDLRGLVQVEAELMAKFHGGNNRTNAAAGHPAAIGATGHDEHINPGRLLLATTGIIARTTYLAFGHIAVSIALLLYSASAFSSLEKYFVAPYAGNLAAWVVAAAATHLFLGAASGFHAMKMQAPIVALHAFPRILMQVVTFVLLLLSFLQLIVLIVAKLNLFKGETQQDAWMTMAAAQSDDLCNFMTRKQCNGYNQPCSVDSTQCVASCLGFVSAYGSVTCESAISDAIANSLLPILVIVAVCLVLVIGDILYMVRYAHVAKRLARALA